MVKIIAIMGEAGSGKDYLVKKLTRDYPELFHEIVSCTTRPKREREIDGVDYYYLSEDQFKANIQNNKMLEYAIFRNWFYGTLLDSLSETKINLGVFNPAGVESLLKNKNVQVIVYRLSVHPKERLLRQLTREEYPDVNEIIRRYETDKKDFAVSPPTTINVLINNNFDQLKENILTIVNKAKEDWDKSD